MEMDYLVRGTARNDKIRIIGCECKDTVSLICKKHGCYPIATVALGRFLCGTLMMGAMLKDKQTITCSTKNNNEDIFVTKENDLLNIKIHNNFDMNPVSWTK